MHALTGTITKIESSDDKTTHTVTVKPVAILPDRTSPPKWLKDATLTVTRTGDVRDVGHLGDALTLTPQESARYLTPLTLDLPVLHGKMPALMTATLAWWKDDKPAELVVSANSRRVPMVWAKAGEGWTATLSPGDFFADAPTLPVTFSLECGDLRATATVLPGNAHGFLPVPSVSGERMRASNPFVSVEVLPARYAGGVISLTEAARGYEHFRVPNGDIQGVMQKHGHIPVLRAGYIENEKVKETALAVAGTRVGAEGARLTLEGAVEDTIRTTASFTLSNDLPLVLLSRDFHLGKTEEKKGDGDAKPKLAVDGLRSFQDRFVAMVAREGDGAASGTRILCGDGETLWTFREPMARQGYEPSTWRLADHYLMVEQPVSRGYLLYLFDEGNAPRQLWYWSDVNHVSVTISAGHRAMDATGSLGQTCGVAAGECGGAGDGGAWVACRDDAGNVAVVARLKTPNDLKIALTTGGKTATGTLERRHLAGVGVVWTAILPDAAPDTDTAIFGVVAGMHSRGVNGFSFTGKAL